MTKRYYPWITLLAVCSLSFLALALLRPVAAKAQPAQQYPIMDKVADKISGKIAASAFRQRNMMQA